MRSRIESIGGGQCKLTQVDIYLSTNCADVRGLYVGGSNASCILF